MAKIIVKLTDSRTTITLDKKSVSGAGYFTIEKTEAVKDALSKGLITFVKNVVKKKREKELIAEAEKGNGKSNTSQMSTGK